MSSVKTKTLFGKASLHVSYTYLNISFPKILANGLPGNLVDLNLAGINMAKLFFFFHTKIYKGFLSVFLNEFCRILI